MESISENTVLYFTTVLTLRIFVVIMESSKEPSITFVHKNTVHTMVPSIKVPYEKSNEGTRLNSQEHPTFPSGHTSKRRPKIYIA